LEQLQTISLGICGLGTVGGGTWDLLRNNQAQLNRRLGFKLQVIRIATRTLKPELTDDNDHLQVSCDPFDVVNDPAVDVVIETMGGFDPALSLVMQAIENGKHVVTANKALIAVHGNEIFAKAQEHGVAVAFESSVAGGIPVIKALREGLAANDINWLAGIINGTGNYILTEMGAARRQFSEVLEEAQQLGYAEADPTFDVEGIDAAHKLTIMAAIAFGIPLNFEKTYTEGISQITPEDIAYAKQLGYRIKHLGIARITDKGVEMRVHPTLISKRRLLANVNGVGNAVLVNGNAVGSTLYYGPGAGAAATASSVVADVIDIGRALCGGLATPLVPALGNHELRTDLSIMPIEEIESEYYLRIAVEDKVGVMAKVSRLLEQANISIEAVIQKEAVSDNVPIIILTHRALEKNLNQVINAIENLEEVSGAVTRIRVEQFEGEGFQ